MPDFDTLIETFASKVAEKLSDTQAAEKQEDDLMTQSQINAKYFHVGHEDFMKIVRQPGFPKTRLTPKKFKYSKIAVEKWIATHQEYHH